MIACLFMFVNVCLCMLYNGVKSGVISGVTQCDTNKIGIANLLRWAFPDSHIANSLGFFFDPREGVENCISMSPCLGLLSPTLKGPLPMSL